MSRYLDPKNDIIFKAIFTLHPDLLISFLNGLLPLPIGREIVELEYLPAEQVPDNPLKKDSIVDVKCRDNYGRIFIVEMQMYWTANFNYRLVFNASKAFTYQMNKGDSYESLKPVYALAILNDVYDKQTDEYYHRYQIANLQNPDEVIEAMEFVLVELPKFIPEKIADKRMAVLWLRFLREIGEKTIKVSEELTADPYIVKAIELCERAAFSEGQLNDYEDCWDFVSRERTRIQDAERLGREKGREEGREEGIEIGRLKGKLEAEKRAQEEILFIAKNLLSRGMTHEQVAEITQLPIHLCRSLPNPQPKE